MTGIAVTKRWRVGIAVLVAARWRCGRSALDFGLPAVYNPDEIAIMSRALAFAKGDLNPHNFLYPTFYFYALFAWIGGYFVLARITGSVASLSAFQQRFFVDPSGIYLAGRALGAVCGALRTGGDGGARAARCLTCRRAWSAPRCWRWRRWPCMDGHYVKHDVAATLAIMVALWRLARCWPEGGAPSRCRPRSRACASLACGVAWSMHYYCVFLAVPLALTVVDARRARAEAATAKALARCADGRGACSSCCRRFCWSSRLPPGATSSRTVRSWWTVRLNRGLFANLRRYVELLVDGAHAAGRGARRNRRACSSWRPTAGGRCCCFRSRCRFCCSSATPCRRAAISIPVLPFVVLLAALAIRDIAAALAARRRVWVMAVLTLLAGRAALADSVDAVAFFAQDDTRTLATRLIQALVPDGATILIQPYSVQLAQSRESLEESLRARLGSLEPLPTRARLRLAVVAVAAPVVSPAVARHGGLDEDKIYLSSGNLAATRSRPFVPGGWGMSS